MTQTTEQKNTSNGIAKAHALSFWTDKRDNAKRIIDNCRPALAEAERNIKIAEENIEIWENYNA